MKKYILAAIFPLFLIPAAQAQSQPYSKEIPLYSSNLRMTLETMGSLGYPTRFLTVPRKDPVGWIFDHNKVTPGTFKLVLPFPLVVYKTRDERTEMAFAATSDKSLVLFRYWF